MFDKLGDWLFSLLPGPLKKQKNRNQFAIFLSVIGSVFDDIKTDMLRMREESIIFTASPCMLDVFAAERDMFRIAGESEEDFRNRLMAKADIAAMAGTSRGILYALWTVGYTNCTIDPLYKTDPARWAEVYISFHMDSVEKDNSIDFACIKREVQKTKQASTLPHYRFFYPTEFQGTEQVGETILTNLINIAFYDGVLFLDGSWLLDGKHKLDAELVQLDTSCTIRMYVEGQEILGELKITVNNNLWYLDGTVELSGTHTLNAYQEVTHE